MATGNREALRILLLEDTPADAQQIEQQLRRAGLSFVCRVADSRESLAAALRDFAPDLVLSDYRLPGMTALDAIELLRQAAPTVPLIVVTGSLTEEIAADCIKAGAADYVLKENLVRLPSAVSHALELKQMREDAARVHDELREREQRYRALVEHSYDAVALLDPRGTVQYASHSTERVLGYTRDEFVGRNIFELMHPDELAGVQELFLDGLRGPGKPVHAEFRLRHKDGSWRFLEGVAVNRTDQPAVRAIVANYRDITERKRVEAALMAREQRLTLAARGANDGLWDWDLAHNVVYYSPRWKSMLGHAEPDIGDSPDEWFTRIHPDDVEHVRAVLAAHLAGRAPRFETEYRIRHEGGSYRWMLTRGLAVRDGQSRPLRIAGMQTDVTERKAVEARLFDQAVRDPLTGLANRAYFRSLLEEAIDRSHRGPDYRFAVLFVDLDDFKVVNDTHGHLIGDQCLIAVARRLEGSVRPGDTVARLGGDEFTVLLDGAGDLSDVHRVVERVQSALASTFEVGGHQIAQTASIGIALSVTGYASATEILHAADRAMYRAKSGGGARAEHSEPH